MSALELIGLVIVLLAAAAVVLLVVRRRSRDRRAAARGPRTVGDLVRMRAQEKGTVTGGDTPAPSGAEAAAQPEPAPAAEAEGEQEVEPVAPGPAAPTAAEPPGVSVPEQATRDERAAETRPAAPNRVPVQASRAPEPTPVHAGATAEKAPRAPGPDAAGMDTPWHRAELMAAGDGGAGTWQPPAPVAPVPVATEPVPLRLVPAVEGGTGGPEQDRNGGDGGDTGDADPGPDSWTGWADWAAVDAEEAEEEAARSARREEPAGSNDGPSAEPPAEQATRPAAGPSAEPADAARADPVPTARTESPKIVPTAEAAPAPVPMPLVEPEAEPVARPLGKRTPEERAAEQAAADLALLRTFGFADPGVRPDTAPVVAMVRADQQDAEPVGKGAAQPVRFHVVGRDGAPVPNAAVTLLDDRGLEVAGTTAGPDGRGEVLAPAAGTFALVATARGHQPNVVAVTVAEEPVDVEALLARSASVVGTVQGEDGPITGARVTLVQDGEVVEAVTTADDGSYRIEDIASGEYGLSVAAAGCVPVAAVVEVPDESELRREVVLEPASPTAEYESDGLDDGFDGFDGVDGMVPGHRYS